MLVAYVPDDLLQNILDPNAIIGRDYQQTFIKLRNGNLVAGVITGEDEGTLTLKTLAAPVTILKSDIATRELSPLSMMPVGLLNSLEEPEVRDLFLYLRQSGEP
jgi:putative heme-binding domain-containing protein